MAGSILSKVQDFIADRTGLRLLPDRLLHPREPGVETLKVPGYYQTQQYTCGFVAGMMVLRYFDPDYPVEKFYARVRPDPQWGIRRSRLMDALRLSGVRVTWRSNLDFPAIVNAIDQGRPIITIVHTRNADVKHWVVMYGYGKKPQRVYLAANGAPFLSRKEYPWGMFKQHFWRTPGFGLVCARGKTD